MDNSFNILIIDDEQLIIDSIGKIASYEGFTCDQSLDANEAISKLEQNTYDLIISDIMMPGKSGFDFLEIINQKKINTPVIITTGFSTLENAVKALNFGAMGFIPKPFTLEELVSILHRGIRYNDLMKRTSLNTRLKNDDLLSVIPCPPKYFRLGFDSWCSKEDEGIIKIGLTDLFLKSVEHFRKLELMKKDESTFQGSVCLRIKDSKDLIHQLLAPISGNIIEVNPKLDEDINLLEKDPYFLGWIYKVIPSNLESDLENLTSCSSDI